MLGQEADHAETAITYELEKDRIGDGYHVRRIERFEGVMTEFLSDP
jgi:hypothetical protein